MAESNNVEAVEQFNELPDTNMMDFLVNNVYDDIMSDDSDLSPIDWVKMSQIIYNQELKDTKYYHTIIDALEPINPEYKCNDISCGPTELVKSFHQFVEYAKLDLKGKHYTDDLAILVDTMARVLCDVAIFAKRANMGITKEDLKLIGPRIYVTIKKLQNLKQSEKYPKYTDMYQDKLSTWIKESPDTRAALLVHYFEEDKAYVSLPIGTKHKFKKTKEDDPDEYFIHFRAYQL